LKALFQLNKAVALGLKFIQVLLVGTGVKVETGTEKLIYFEIIL